VNRNAGRSVTCNSHEANFCDIIMRRLLFVNL
jgi:hypothetical protein